MPCVRESRVIDKNTFVYLQDESEMAEMAQSGVRRSVTLPDIRLSTNKRKVEDKVLYHVRESRDVDQLMDNLEPELLDLIKTPSERMSPRKSPVRPSGNLLEFPGMPKSQPNRLEVGGPMVFSVVDPKQTIFGNSRVSTVSITLSTPNTESSDDTPIQFRASCATVNSPRISMSNMACPSELPHEAAPSPMEGQSIREPAEFSLDEFAQEIEVPRSQWTSLMIRNIPCRYTTAELLDEIQMMGFIVDFLYLPPARRSAGNLGYAFVNFVTAEQAAHFCQLFQGYTFSLQQKSQKRAHIIYAKLQGFQANVDFYTQVKITKKKNKPFMDRDAFNFYNSKSCGAN